MTDYWKKFELQSSAIYGITDEALKSSFIKVLKSKIHVEVNLYKHKGLIDILHS